MACMEVFYSRKGTFLATRVKNCNKMALICACVRTLSHENPRKALSDLFKIINGKIAIIRTWSIFLTKIKAILVIGNLDMLTC